MAGSPIKPKDYDERIYHRGLSGMSAAKLGLIALAVIGAAFYLAFAKQLPFVSNGYEIHAVFANAATLRNGSPVRIAGVNVGKVQAVTGKGEAAEVTFTVDQQGRPVHTDATVKIRPRIFLEGNFFLDLRPGSPSAPELPSGGTVPITRTSTAVQLDEILTSLQSSDRQNLRLLLEGLGTGLTHQPTAAEDATQDPSVKGESAATALNRTFTYAGPAERDSAIVNQALLGTTPHDLSRLIAASSKVFGALLTREAQLKDLVTNFNVTAGAFASEASNLSDTIRLLAPTLEQAQPTLVHLDQAFPPLRAWAREIRPGIRELPATINAAGPWLDQALPLLSRNELGGLASQLRATTPNLASFTNATTGFLPQLELASRCISHVLVPTGNVVVNDAFNSGQPNYRELFYSAVGLSGESQGFDGNGQYIRFQPGGGPVLVKAPQPGGGVNDNEVFGHTIAAPLGTQPKLPSSKPAYRPDATCYKQTLPDLNGSAAAVGPPSPEAVP